MARFTRKDLANAMGLKPGDKVIVDGILKVVPGAPVNIVKREELKVEKDKVNTGKKNK